MTFRRPARELWALLSLQRLRQGDTKVAVVSELLEVPRVPESGKSGKICHADIMNNNNTSKNVYRKRW